MAIDVALAAAAHQQSMSSSSSSSYSSSPGIPSTSVNDMDAQLDPLEVAQSEKGKQQGSFCSNRRKVKHQTKKSK
jgi:hypothetical protein